MCDNNLLYKQISHNALAVKAKNSSISCKIEIPESFLEKPVTTIASNGFICCRNIKTIVIPLSIERIEANAFENCSSLCEFIYKGTKSNWHSVSKDILWDANMPTYTIYCTDGTITK